MRPSITSYEEELVEQNAEEHGSKTAAINYAIRQTFGDDDDSEPEMNKELRQAHRILSDHAPNHRISLDTALSVLAQAMRVETSAIRSNIIHPLKIHDKIRVSQKTWSTTLVVSEPDATDADDTNERPLDDLTGDERRAYRALWGHSDEHAEIDLDEAADLVSDEIGSTHYRAYRTIIDIDAKEMLCVDLVNKLVIVKSPTPKEPVDLTDDTDTDTADAADQLDELTETADPVRADGGTQQ